MREAWERVKTAWAALRGHAVIRGVRIDRGEVWLDRHRTFTSRATIQDCLIHPLGPVVLRLYNGSSAEGTHGDGLLRVEQR